MQSYRASFQVFDLWWNRLIRLCPIIFGIPANLFRPIASAFRLKCYGVSFSSVGDKKKIKYAIVCRIQSDHPKCQAEAVAYESLDHNGSKFFLIRIWWLPRLNPCANADAMFYSVKPNFKKKKILPFEKYPFLVLARNTIMLPHLIIHSSLHYLSTGRIREVKNKGKF